MPVITKTATISDAEIRQALADWISGWNAGDGPNVSPDDIVFKTENGLPIEFDLSAEVDF